MDLLLVCKWGQPGVNKLVREPALQANSVTVTENLVLPAARNYGYLALIVKSSDFLVGCLEFVEIP